MLHGKTLQLDPQSSPEETVAILKALASLPRWKILECLVDSYRSVNEIATLLDIPTSTAAAHIKILNDAGLLRTELQAASHGLQKICTRTYDNLVVQLPSKPVEPGNSVEVAMPIGSYSVAEVTPTCGLAGEDGLIGFLDDPLSFYEPERMHAGLLWFRSGSVEYHFPNRLPAGASPDSLQVSMEICSEAPGHRDDWPSDITLWINGRELGTWTCPGDFGGRRGQLTPQWWDSGDTQFGLLKRWQVSGSGSYIDGHKLSSVTIDDLNLSGERLIAVRLGVKPDALHVGGLNLFGRSFGNYLQDLILRIDYTPRRRVTTASHTLAERESH